MKSSMLKYKWMCIAVFCCAMFAACEPTEVASDKNSISFGSGRKQASTPINANARLWGYTNTGAVIFDGVDAEYKDGILTPDVIRYWADNQFYNFYSVWPVVDGNGISDIAFNKTNSQLSFKADISNQNENTDFCIAAAVGEEGNADRERAVQMTYKHALSKVQFYGFSSTTGTTAQLTNFTITVPKSANAVCTLNENTEERTTDENNVTTEYPLTITYTFADSDNTKKGVDSTDLYVSNTEEPFELKHSSDENSNGTQVLEKLVLPMSDGQFHVAATYKIGNETKTVETDIEANWSPGKNYIYKFYIQPAGPIIFADEVTINDWGTETDAGDVEFK